MGCDGCELFPTHSGLIKTIRTFLQEANVKCGTHVDQVLQSEMKTLTVTDVYHSRRRIAASLLQADIPLGQPQHKQVEALARAVADEFRCYAAILHLRHGKDINKPDKRTNPGYARIFEEVKQFRGRVVQTAKLRDLRGTVRPEKPWLDGSRRLIFMSDMGDLLSKAISFEYIRDEVIANVTSAEGARHIWLWLSKRPSRMARFSEWLEAQGIGWPDNLVAMTSVTSTKTAGRVEQLKKVRCRLRGLSVEPLWNAVRLPLEGIDWTIVGGESGAGARPFDLIWARDLQEQCRESGTAFFLKQAGSRPKECGANLHLADKHGGTWEEWPIDLRVRELPNSFLE
jgi:protein gp37